MRRYLVVANQTLGGDELYDVVQGLLSAGSCSFHILVPATPPNEHLTWTEGDARAIASDRLERALAWFRELGAEVEGEVGDANPLLAIWDTLQARDLDHIIVSTLPAGISRWIKMDLPSRVEGAFAYPSRTSSRDPRTGRQGPEELGKQLARSRSESEPRTCPFEDPKNVRCRPVARSRPDTSHRRSLHTPCARRGL